MTTLSLQEQVEEMIAEERSLVKIGDENSYGHLMTVTALINVLAMIDKTAKELEAKRARYNSEYAEGMNSRDTAYFGGREDGLDDALARLVKKEETKT